MLNGGLMSEQNIDKEAVVSVLNKILEMELATVVCYSHYSLMIYGYNRIPIVSWFRSQATASLTHANEAGEMVTGLGEHPSLSIVIPHGALKLEFSEPNCPNSDK